MIGLVGTNRLRAHCHCNRTKHARVAWYQAASLQFYNTVPGDLVDLTKERMFECKLEKSDNVGFGQLRHVAFRIDWKRGTVSVCLFCSAF